MVSLEYAMGEQSSNGGITGLPGSSRAFAGDPLSFRKLCTLSSSPGVTGDALISPCKILSFARALHSRAARLST